VRVALKAAGYRFLPGHRVRLSIASANWPVIWPSPYAGTNRLHWGPGTPSRLTLPSVPGDSLTGDAPADRLTPPAFKTTPPELVELGGGSETPSTWQIVEDVLAQTVTVNVADGDSTTLPGGQITLTTAETLALTASAADPARVQLFSRVEYGLTEHGYHTEVVSTGTLRSTATDLHVDLQLEVRLNGSRFFEKRWLESIPRQLW